MLLRSILTIASLAITISVAAAPAIHSLVPNSGPASGGTTVTIHGSGFEICPVCSPPLPPTVLFDGTPAVSVRLVDETKLEVVTPPHREGTASVTVDQHDGMAPAANAYTFTGDIFAGLEPILVPAFTPPVRGAFGSVFETTVVASHRGEGPRILLFGRDTSCFTFTPILEPLNPITLEAGAITIELPTDCSTWPARFFYVPAGQTERTAFNARVHDVSRSNLSHGTEIPVVRASEFTTGPVALLNVPLDPRFRNTLRIYGLAPSEVVVTIDSREHVIALQPGRDEFEPSYAIFSQFAIDEIPANVRVTVRPLTPITSPPTPTVPIWAFVAVTNNDTQEITTITPQP